MSAVTVLISSLQYDMSCHGKRPESIDINTILDDGTQISMDLHTLPNSGRLNFQLDLSADNIPCSVSVTLRNQFGNTDTGIMFGKLKQYMHAMLYTQLQN